MVKTIQMKLDVNKTTANNELIRIRQGDKNSTKLEVEVLYDGQPYSLTGLSATFNATKPDGKVVVENATISENKIIYVLNSQVGASSGTISKAYFSIKNTSGVEIDSTSNFRIDVLTGTDTSAGSSDYVDSLESTRLKAQNLLTQIEDSIAVVDGVVAQINTLGQQASNTLKEKLEGLSTQATTGVNEIKAQLQELISAKIADIQSQADTKLASIQEDWNTLKSQLQAEINALSTKVSGIDDKSNAIKSRLDALVVQLDSIDIVSVKNTADKATADIAELRERKTYLHTAYSWSADGADRFMTVYPGENLVLNSSNMTSLAHWVGPAVLEKHLFYKNGTENLFRLDNDTKQVVNLASDRVNVEGGKQYTIRFKGFQNDNLINFNLWFLWRRKDSTEYYDDAISAILYKRISSSGIEVVEAVITAPEEAYTAYLRFDNKGTYEDGINAGLWFTEVSLREGNQKGVPYTPSPLDDPDGAYPKFIGTYTDYTAKDSTDSAKYEWIPMPRPNEKNVLTVEGEIPDKFGNVVIPQIAQNALDIKNLATQNNSQDVTISKLTKSVNGIKPDASGNISLPHPDLSPYATTTAMNTAINNAKSYADTKKSESQSYTDTKLSGVLKSWTGTQAQYDAIAIKDSNTLYIIKEG